jgi:hypothetical protein
MANTQSAIFIAQFSEEIKQAFQQTESKLQNAVRAHRNVVGSTYSFPYLGKFTANTKARNADVTGLEPVHSTVLATLVDSYAPIYLDSLDQLKTNVSLREEYVRGTVSAINRVIDQTIITAAVAGTITTATTAGGWTYAKHLEAVTLLNAADVDEQDRYMIICAKQFGEMMNETKVISADYTAGLIPVMSGKIGTFMGFNVIMSNLLPLASTTRTCLYFNKKAIGLAVGQDPKTEVNYIPQKVSTLVNTMVSLGSVIVDPAGVVEMTCTE